MKRVSSLVLIYFGQELVLIQGLLYEVLENTAQKKLEEICADRKR
jgi:hypothetical protein